MGDLKIESAKLVSNGECRLPSECSKTDGPFECWECHMPLFLKQGKIKAAHFSHFANGDKKSLCNGGESAIHKKAKRLIEIHLTSWNFYRKSCDCGEKDDDPVYYDNDFCTKVEHTVYHQEKKYVIDVAVVHEETKKMVRAIEVYHTHPIETMKREDLIELCGGDVPFQINARSIIEQAELKDWNLEYDYQYKCYKCLSRECVECEERSLIEDMVLYNVCKTCIKKCDDEKCENKIRKSHTFCSSCLCCKTFYCEKNKKDGLCVVCWDKKYKKECLECKNSYLLTELKNDLCISCTKPCSTCDTTIAISKTHCDKCTIPCQVCATINTKKQHIYKRYIEFGLMYYNSLPSNMTICCTECVKKCSTCSTMITKKETHCEECKDPCEFCKKTNRKKTKLQSMITGKKPQACETCVKECPTCDTVIPHDVYKCDLCESGKNKRPCDGGCKKWDYMKFMTQFESELTTTPRDTKRFGTIRYVCNNCVAECPGCGDTSTIQNIEKWHMCYECNVSRKKRKIECGTNTYDKKRK